MRAKGRVRPLPARLAPADDSSVEASLVFRERLGRSLVTGVMPLLPVGTCCTSEFGASFSEVGRTVLAATGFPVLEFAFGSLASDGSEPRYGLRGRELATGYGIADGAGGGSPGCPGATMPGPVPVSTAPPVWPSVRLATTGGATAMSWTCPSPLEDSSCDANGAIDPLPWLS
jgi:hypothetical protein